MSALCMTAGLQPVLCSTKPRTTLLQQVVRGSSHKSGVCEDYARTYAYLLKMAGMEARFLVIKSWDHAITQVKIDGKWYNADATSVTDPLNYPTIILGSDQLNRLSDSDGITCCSNYDDQHYEGTKYHIGDAYDTKYDNYNYCKQACEEMMKKYFN